MSTVSIKKTLFNYLWIISCLILLFIVVCAGWFATGYLGDKARQEILEYNESNISLHSSHLTAKFEKIERAVKTLSGSPWIAPALVSRKEQDIANANSVLDRYNKSLESSVSYLMDSDGKTIASSNRNDSDSFVGKSYQFRPYFTQAINGAPGQYFALGATSLKRGLYASYPVRESKGQIAGVVAIKQDVDTEEADLGKYPYYFVVNPNGIIFLSGKKEMNFKSLWPVSRETQLALLKSKQFGEKEFDSILPREVSDGMEITLYGKNYIASRKVINPEGWSIVLMTTTKRVLIYRLAGVIITILMCTFVIVPFVISYKTSRSAEMVRESEKRYRQLFERNLAGVYRTTIDGRLLDCNDAFARIYGYESRDEAMQHPVVDFHVNPNARQEFVAALQAGGRLLDFESQGRRKDGGLIWRLENTTLVSGEEGGLTEIEGTLVDITARKMAEAALKSSLSLLSASLESTADGILIVDRKGKIARWNQKFADMWKIPEDVLSSRDDEKTINHILTQLADPEQFVAKVRKLYEQPEESSFDQIEFADGRVFERYSQPQRIEDSIVGRVWSFRDITERRQAEEALRESEKKYRNILENIEDGYFEVNTAGNFTFFNNSTCRILGYSADELMDENNLEYVDDENANKIFKIYDEVHRTGLPTRAFDWQLIRKDGSKCFVETVVSLITDSNNVKTGFRGIVRDITERNRAEEEKVKMEEQYRQAQKMEAIGQLAGGVAHDFNNMLNIIIGYSQMALMKIEISSPLKANLQEIMNAAQRSADLVRQLLAFARKQIIAPKVLDVNDAVAGMLNMLRKLIGENVDLLWMPAANLWPVKMDPAQIDQIVANLAVNARDSIPGVGKITIETGKAEFDEVYCAQHTDFVPGQYVLLAVSDNGCGMDKETLGKIFEPFFTTKEVGKGTGMGLATVYGIVQQNNGFIDVYSEPGKGTTFNIYLPRLKEEWPANDEPRVHAELLTGTETVLLVEDEETLLKMGKMMLEELGYEVLAAGSPKKAIQLAEQYAGDIHLVLTDVVMPEMSGRDLMKRLSDLRPGIKCLFMSGYTANVIAHRGILDEGVNFLQKPFFMDDLAAKVREVMEK